MTFDALPATTTAWVLAVFSDDVGMTGKTDPSGVVVRNWPCDEACGCDNRSTHLFHRRVYEGLVSFALNCSWHPRHRLPFAPV